MPWQYSWVDPLKGSPHKGKGNSSTNSNVVPGDGWTCGWCATTMPSVKTKCATCGLRRKAPKNTSTPAATSPQKTQEKTPTAGQSVRESIQQVAASLKACAASPPPQVFAKPPPVNATDADTGFSSLATDKEKMTLAESRVKSLESTLESIPQEEYFASARKDIESRLARAKSDLQALRPVGARLDAARQAVQRAQQRADDAKAAVDMAIKVHDKASLDLETSKQALTDMEKEWDASIKTEAPPQMTTFKDTLTNMMDLLRAQPGVDATHVQQASDHMEQLFYGFEKVMEHACNNNAAK